jgi:hypothetical protein
MQGGVRDVDAYDAFGDQVRDREIALFGSDAGGL